MKKNNFNFLEPPQEHFDILLKYYQTGQYTDAEKLSLSITHEFPEHPFAWKILAAVLKQTGRTSEALIAIQKSLQLNPQDSEVHNNLGTILQKTGKLNDAEASYRKAIVLDPNLDLAHYNLANILKKTGKLNDAESCYRKVIVLKPDSTNALNNLGSTLEELGRLEEAEASYRKVITLKPDFANAHNNLGNILKGTKRLEEAETCYRQAITLKPDLVQAHNNLGSTLEELGRLEEAQSCYEKAIRLKPDYAESHNNLGNTLQYIGNLNRAESSYRKAIALKPELAEAYYNLGSILNFFSRFEEAEICYRQAITLKPDYADAHYNLGNLLSLLKKIDESLISYNNAYILKPDIDFLFGSLLHTKMQLCIWGDLPQHLDELTKKISNKENVISPFSLLSIIDDPSIHKKAAEIISNKKFQKSGQLPKILPYNNHKKIRIGYFSPDFRNHPVSYLTAELYEIHDRNKFEIHAFSFGPNTKDELNIRVKTGVDYFHDVQIKSNLDIVKLARSLEIDIAIDLAGFTSQARTNIFAISAAPIQVNYLGYPGTMAADYIDYIIADHTLIPNEKKKLYTEKIVYLPNSFMPNESKIEIGKKIFTRENCGLPVNGFVFCCFNNQYKITPTIFNLWINILSKVEGSVLWLSQANKTVINNLEKEMLKFGINKDRIIYAPNLPLKKDYMNRIKLADLFLDTMPFNAHATASDALRIGLPVLTFVGDSFASRVAASLLKAVNLPEMITTTKKEYETLAIQLATHPEKFKKIKDKLAKNLLTTSLYDTSLYVRNLETAYQTMYEKYQKGLDIVDINVEC